MTSDRELVTRVTGSDDQAAFQLLVERHQAAIRGFLRRLTGGDHGTADALAQETFLLAYRKLHTLKAGSSLVSWLHTIAYRQWSDFKLLSGISNACSGVCLQATGIKPTWVDRITDLKPKVVERLFREGRD